MRLTGAVAFTLLVTTTSGFAIETGYPTKPICPTQATQSVWENNFKGCMKAFIEPIKNKVVEKLSVENMCHCAADGIVNAQNCDDIKKMNQSAFEDQVIKSVQAHCMSLFKLKRLDSLYK